MLMRIGVYMNVMPALTMIQRCCGVFLADNVPRHVPSAWVKMKKVLRCN